MAVGTLRPVATVMYIVQGVAAAAFAGVVGLHLCPNAAGHIPAARFKFLFGVNGAEYFVINIPGGHYLGGSLGEEGCGDVAVRTGRPDTRGIFVVQRPLVLF